MFDINLGLKPAADSDFQRKTGESSCFFISLRTLRHPSANQTSQRWWCWMMMLATWIYRLFRPNNKRLLCKRLWPMKRRGICRFVWELWLGAWLGLTCFLSPTYLVDSGTNLDCSSKTWKTKPVDGRYWWILCTDYKKMGMVMMVPSHPKNITSQPSDGTFPDSSEAPAAPGSPVDEEVEAAADR